MKKIFLLLLSLVAVVGISACKADQIEMYSADKGGSGSVSVTTAETSDADAIQRTFNDEEILKNLTTTTYTWKEGTYSYVALIVKNNSNQDCQLSANVVYKNAEGQVIGADDDSIDMLEKNTEACLIVNNEDEFSSFDYTYEVEKAEYYKAASSSVSCEASITSDKAVLTFKNNGTKQIDSSYTVLFMQGDAVVDYSTGYLSDLKSGLTKTEENNFYNSQKGFDNIKVYYSAYSIDY